MDRVAIVTGGGRGIGWAITKQLYEDGYQVACLGRKKYTDVDDLIISSHHKVEFFPYDLSNYSLMDKTLEQVIQRFGRIDVLVNNAGIAPSERLDILQTTMESFDQLMKINVKGTFFFTQKVAKKMLQQKKFNYPLKIVNIASVSSYASSTNRGEYCISKAGISMITKLFADRLSREDIFVYEIRPGIIKTDMTRSVEDKYNQYINEGVFPIPRWGYPEDVANAVSLFVDDKFCYSTGEIINVDGGYHLRRL